MASAEIKSAVAVTVQEQAPNTNYNALQLLGTRTGGVGDAIAYIYFSRPFPLKSNIISATFTFYTTAMTSGTHPFNFLRLGQAFNATKVTWNTRPTASIAGTKTVTKTGALADRTEWEVDLTDWMQAVSAGGKWYGFSFRTTESTARSVYSEINSLAAYRPRLEVRWSDAPVTPTGLEPSGGRLVGTAKPELTANFIDLGGENTISVMQVQLNPTNVWTNPFWDSGTFADTSAPIFYLDGILGRDANLNTVNGSATVTSATPIFDAGDVGAAVEPRTGFIPSGTTIVAVASATSATMSTPATGTASPVTPPVTITRSYPGLADGATTYWRCRFKDESGLWSPWSAATTFKRDDRGTLTMSSPPSGTPVVEDNTPPIIWTLTGEVQSAYQIVITHPSLAPRLLPPIVDWDSGKVTSSATTVTVPKGVINEMSGTTYTVRLRVWDKKQRQSVPSCPAHVSLTRQFTWVPGATSGTTGLTAVAQDPVPKVLLTWSRTSAPDRFNVIRNGKAIATGLAPEDVFVSGTSYSWVDRSPNPGRLSTYSVQAVVNNIAAASNASASVTPRPSGIWLQEDEQAGGLELYIAGADDREYVLGETAEVLQSIAYNANKVAINQSLGGIEGRVEGVLINQYGKTAQQWRDIYLKFRAQRVKRFWLTIGDYTFLAVCQGFTYGQRAIPEYTFKVGFDFYQQNDLGRTLPLGS